MSSLGSIYLGVSGLNISQNALNTTAHNLANVDTKGYVRQQVVLKDFGYVKLGENHISLLQKGLGVDFEAVKQVRDVFLDKAYRQEIGRQAFYDAQYRAIEEVEGLFGEMEGVSFQETLNDLWVSLQELAKEPDSIVTRASFVQSAVSFIERAENIAYQMKDYQVNLNTQIEDMVNRINTIGDELKNLNSQIRYYESNGVENANDLRDQRNVLLDELGKLVNITYREDHNGVVTVNVEGASFVTEDLVFHMDTKKLTLGSDMVTPVWSSRRDAEVFNFDRLPSSEANTDIGYLKGLLLARGDRQANYLDIPVRTKPEGEDPILDAQYDKKVEEYNTYIASSTIMDIQAKFDQLVHGIVTTINDILCPNTEDSSGTVILDVDKAPICIDGRLGLEGLFKRKAMDRYTLDEDKYIFNGEDPNNYHSLYTIGEIEINPLILQDYANLNLSSNAGTGDYDKDAVERLLTSWQEPFATLSPNTLTYHSFSEYYNAFISGIANRGEQLNSISSNQGSMVNSIDNKRMETTAVSSDEELSNLIKFQHSYNAAARYITVVDQMLEHIIMRL
ncbi:MAG: flagellar hook-associated protein FlgK [Clostridiales bacterium]|mgnify:CR=1 FL=1|nr:flagellar hook-associated protein FlgK [Clostridiales bacterium]